MLFRSRVDCLTEDLIDTMVDAGLKGVNIGIESTDPNVIRNAKRGWIDPARIERMVRHMHERGVRVSGFFIIGLPGESRESIETTINFAKELDCETIQVSLAHPYPGTEFYDHVVKNELITLDSMTDEMGHQLPNIIYPGLDRGELVDSVERFYSEYYFRPKAAWRIVKNAMFDANDRKQIGRAHV